MNVLILTPDRVGSTLLQRVLTVYLLGQNPDKPVINLHELTNGLTKYYSPELNQEVLGKPKTVDWGYFQSLSEVIDLLKSADHYKTSRLAHYHILRRKDNIDEQIRFYEYLNNNFFIIGCRRENLFEHALSWVINAHSKKLNVYSVEEKINTFQDIYKNKITASRELLIKYLNDYRNYIDWSDTYFNVQSYFNYDTDIHDLEKYILNLDLMKQFPKKSWNDMFGQDFKDYNTCHRMLPNLYLLDSKKEATKQISYFASDVNKNWHALKGSSWPNSPADYFKNSENLPLEIKNEIDQSFGKIDVKVTEDEYNFLSRNLSKYVEINEQMDKLVSSGFLVTGIPVKLQSLKEKQLIIENFNQCIDWYNEWVEQNNFGKIYSQEDLSKIGDQEESKLNSAIFNQIEFDSAARLQIT